jgi:putative oxidoreductase
MRYTLPEGQKDVVILLARILLMILYLSSGWGKLTHFAATSDYIASTGAPFPEIATCIAIFMELAVGAALVVGFWTRPLALLMAVFTLAAAILVHHYWTMTGSARSGNFIHFYKNISIIGGLLLLAVTGPGRYSLDRN